MKQPTITLADGDEIPAVGLGLWQIPSNAVATLVDAALTAGYRHFDCACDYGNEAAVGAALKASSRPREDLWVTSKLWNTYHAPEHVRPACERSLKGLGLDYLDLYLIHFPIALRYVPFETRYPPEWIYDPNTEQACMEFSTVSLQETWRAMEDLQRAGLVKHIGICNYATPLLRDLLSYAAIRPAVLQIERHPYLSQPKLLQFCAEEHIAVTGFSPLGGSSYVALDMAEPDEPLIKHTVISEIASAHSRSPAQVLLRWGLQSGTAVIPKTSKPERLLENIHCADFNLSTSDMQRINGLNQHRRFNDPGVFCEQAFGTFCPIFD